MATISGDIGLMPVGDLVIWVANRALSCTLVVRRRGAEAKLVIRDGQLWQAASSDPREYLGPAVPAARLWRSATRMRASSSPVPKGLVR